MHLEVVLEVVPALHGAHGHPAPPEVALVRLLAVTLPLQVQLVLLAGLLQHGY